MGYAVVNKKKESFHFRSNKIQFLTQTAPAGWPADELCCPQHSVLPTPAINGEQLIALRLSTGFVRRLHLKVASIATTIILQAIVGSSSYNPRVDSLRKKFLNFT
jgi:hypothetical protein